MIEMSVPAVTPVFARMATLPPEFTVSDVPALIVELSAFTPAPTSVVVIDIPPARAFTVLKASSSNLPPEVELANHQHPPSRRSP